MSFRFIGRRVVVLAAMLAIAAAAVHLAGPASAKAVCAPEPGAKGVPLYDKPNGKVVRAVDVDPTWRGGPGLTLIGSTDGVPATTWLEVKDASGALIGYLSGADWGISCRVSG